MLATPWPAHFDDPDWVFELKWDGVRCLLANDGNAVTLTSRAGNDMTHQYPELAGLDLPSDLVLDGEIVALDGAGRPSFELLQARMGVIPPPGRGPAVPVTYVVFDILHNKQPTIRRPLEERQQILAGMALPAPVVVADHFVGESASIWRFVEENELEGLVAKRMGSRYTPGLRSADWRKISRFKQIRAVVGGYTPGVGGRAGTFGALQLGLIDGERLRWVGAVGTGFDDRSLHAIRHALDQMRADVSPFHADDGLPADAVWVEPNLVAVVRLKQWTRSGKLRAPSFVGFSDEPVERVTWIAEGPDGSPTVGENAKTDR